METDDEESGSDDVTSIEASELRSDLARVCDASGYSEIPLNSTRETSMFLLSNSIPVRERGHSLSVERTPGLLALAPEPRSKSLRLKKIPKDSK